MEHDKEKQLYEVGYLITPILGEEEAQNFHQTIKNEAQNIGAIIDDEGRTEKRYLSYPIKKQKEAYFAYFRFFLDNSKLSVLDLKIKKIPEVLRFLAIKTPRPQQRTISTRPFKRNIETKSSEEKIVQEKVELPAADIKEIDRKLEEILGK